MAQQETDPDGVEEIDAQDESQEEEMATPFQVDEQLGDAEDDSEVEEALRAWAAGGHAAAELEEGDEIKPVEFAQLEPGHPQVKPRPNRLNNIRVTVSVELGRKYMTVRQLSQLKEQEVLELDKLAGESFEIRVNGRLFAWGEVVVVTDVMGVRITSLIDSQASRGVEEEE